MQGLQHWSVSVDADNLCWLTLDVAGKSVNVLTHAVMAELGQILDWLDQQDNIAGIGMLSGKPGGFVYGADIAEFELLTTADDVLQHMQMVHGLFNRMESFGAPTIVGIDGIAVGGGLEIALTFDRLLTTASNKTKLGFPEVNLGILPGYGGSGRAYGRVGTAVVTEMMMSGKPLSANAALAAGLIDETVDDAADLQPTMATWLTQQSQQKPPRQQRENTADQSALDAARAQFLKRLRADHSPAPFAIIDHVARHGHSAAAMSAGEMDIFPDLMVGTASKNLRRLYYLTDKVRKTARGNSAIQNLHVVGAGVMGGDIAAVAAMSGLKVTLTDMNENAMNAAIDRAAQLFARRLKSDDKITAARNRLTADPDGHGAAHADLVIEAVAEKLPVKQAVFAALEQVIKPDAILATNTSAIPLEDIAAALQDPSRLIGLHFFNPVPVLPLVEVIWSQYSNQDFVTRGMQFAGQIGKMPIRCQSAPGFLVNRALLPYMFKAVEAVAAGEDADQIDESLVEFGMPMGPIELCDQVGLDVCLDVGMVLGIAPAAEAVLREKCEAQNLGRKTGTGFYQWDGNRPIRPRAAVDAARMADIAAAMLAPMIEQCQQAVDEGVVDSADSADAGMIFGTGFPGFRGGPLHWSQQ
jgi:3-hydroxyacyl-CoA dehydrogenase/enoyl-CoA hydratase/3-hydroxybutyryl-CoA epimerase